MNNLWDWMIHFGSKVEVLVLTWSESLWIYPGLFMVSLIDAIFPLVPSESVVIATSVTAASEGNPLLIGIFLAAACGAWCGDQIAYLIGAKIDVRKIGLFKRERWRRSLDWAETKLETRGSTFIIAARFIPMGRVVVNLMAGALHYPHRRFMAIDGVAVVIWAGWGILLGTVAASIFKDKLLLSIVVGIVGGTVLGILVDKLLSKLGFGTAALPDLAGQIEVETEEQRVARIAARREARQENRARRHDGSVRDDVGDDAPARDGEPGAHDDDRPMDESVDADLPGDERPGDDPDPRQ
ncbi:DedA family protein [Demequina aurantiaca]|uniref:DedA family protein n=1 Tax=Demequina aurantiaca TaxID=676200 RepID=UPI003D34B7EE